MGTSYWRQVKDAAAALRTVKHLFDTNTARARAGCDDLEVDPTRFERSQDLLRDAVTQFGASLVGRDSAPARDVAAEAQAMLDEVPALEEAGREWRADYERERAGEGPTGARLEDAVRELSAESGTDDCTDREDLPAPHGADQPTTADQAGEVVDEPPDRGRIYPPIVDDGGLPRDPHDAAVEQVLDEISETLDPTVGGQFAELDELDDIGNEVLNEWYHEQDCEEAPIHDGDDNAGLAADPLDEIPEVSDSHEGSNTSSAAASTPPWAAADGERPDPSSTVPSSFDWDMAEADRLLREVVEGLDADTVAEFDRLDRGGSAELALFEAPRATDVPDAACDEPDPIEQADAAIAELQSHVADPAEDDSARDEQLALWHSDDTHAAGADDSAARGEEDTW